MSLLHPTTGDIWDRLLLVKIKIEKAKAVKKPCAHFEKEMYELAEEAARRPEPRADLISDIMHLHMAIWDGIDTMMARPTITDENAKAIANTGVNLQVWNTERIRIKAEIDKFTGEYVGEEKV